MWGEHRIWGRQVTTEMAVVGWEAHSGGGVGTGVVSPKKGDLALACAVPCRHGGSGGARPCVAVP